MAEEEMPASSADAFEQAANNRGETRYLLKLYVAGNTSRSQMAIINIRKVCEEYLPGRYQLEVIDLYQNPALARDEQIIATPTLVKSLPLPVRKVIGDLSKEDRIRVGLDLIK